MAYGTPRADDRVEVVRQMNNHVVLKIRPLTHHDPRDISAENGTVKNTRSRPERHVTHHRGIRRHPVRERNVGFFR